MLYFIIGLVILVVGGLAYAKVCENTFGPDDRDTPAITMADGVDYVPMKQWKNSLVQLLNIAGTGPILGPIQGILFGPIAFITIPIGNVLAGSMHDYFSGMISLRNKGAQMPLLVRKYLGAKTKAFYNIIVTILMLLVGAVFTSIPGELFVSQILGQDAVISNPVLWIVYGVIFLYYFAATLFPIDAIIGRIYPIFGGFLILSSVGIFGGVLLNGSHLTNIDWSNLAGQNQMLAQGQPFVPIFFVTVACGILSGFHATQATMISRTVESEKEGKLTFYYMMLVEGFIAMVWAAGAMIIYNQLAPGADIPGATPMVGIISKQFLGTIGGLIAVIGVIVLPITSGDTALRSLRLMLGEQLNINQDDKGKRIALTLAIFTPAAAILVFSKLNPNGFNVLWRYFAFTNQFIATFALSMIAVYLFIHNKNGWIALLPGMFYSFIVLSFILHAKIGFNLDSLLGLGDTSYTASYILAAILTVIYAYMTVSYAKKHGMAIEEIDAIEFLKEK
ncbi:MAG: carbon starvation CstA family protein [Tissierellia bacterium]|nr:carbon starvation CstA family protein [Tissierellia bacterium]